MYVEGFFVWIFWTSPIFQNAYLFCFNLKGGVEKTRGRWATKDRRNEENETGTGGATEAKGRGEKRS